MAARGAQACRVLTTAALVLLTLQACAIVRPHVNVAIPEADRTITRDTAEKSLTEARKWVGVIKQDIAANRDQHQMARWGFFGSALSMIAAVAGLAALGTTGAPIVALGLGSATLATAGTTLPVDERIVVYNTALEAISCVDLVVAAFNFSQKEEDQLFGKITGINPKSLSVLREDVLDRISVFNKAGSLDVEQTRALQALEDVLAKLNTQIPKAMAAYAGREAAPRLYVGQTDQIVSKMNRALSDREPNLRATLFALVPNPSQLLKAGALAPSGGPKAAGPPPGRPAGPDAADAQRLVAQAWSAIEASNAIVSKLSPDPGSAARLCLEQAQQQFARRALTVQVRGSTELHSGGDGVTMSIREGTPPYSVDLVGSAASNLAKSESDVADGRDVRITAVKAAKTGETYTVLVRDSSTPAQTVAQTFVVSAQGPVPLAVALVSGTEPAGPKAELFYRVAGGTPPYAPAALDGAPLKVERIGNETVRVTVTAPAANGETGFRVTDNAGVSTVVTVKVTK